MRAGPLQVAAFMGSAAAAFGAPTVLTMTKRGISAKSALAIDGLVSPGAVQEALDRWLEETSVAEPKDLGARVLDEFSQ